MMIGDTNERALSFGPFHLFPRQRQLLQSGNPLRLGSRAFDLLVMLTGRAGQVVGKEELLSAAWPGTFVEDTSLRVHIAALRKALGDDHAAPRYIINVPGRGYAFVARIVDETTLTPEHSRSPSTTPRPLLPRVSGRVIGRDDLIAALAESVMRRPFVTLVGPGGIGKTTVATATAARIAERFGDGVVFADLTATDNDQQVPGVVANALGHVLRSDEPTAELVAAMRDRHLLVVLDNCEHVIEAAAILAEALNEAPNVHVLTTSRELLRARGEWVQQVPPLDLPSFGLTAASGWALTATEALRSAAVELFVERAAACLGGYALSDTDAPIVAQICQQLDGIALAIELAAGRMNTMGLRELAASLGDCLRVLTQGRRTALPRHQTLRATLDWSYRLLPTSEQAVIRRLAVFNGPFFLEAARAVAAGQTLPEPEIDECVRSLVAKSLVVAELAAPSVRYRLLATTRAFGRERLEAAQEVDRIARQHAAWFQTVFERAQAEWETRSTADWLAEYTDHLSNLRTALDWAFSPAGDASVGIALTVAAVPLWFELSGIDECLTWVQRALAVAEAKPSSYRRQRMHLHAVLGWPCMRAISGFPSGSAAWTTTLALAEDLGDVDFQLRALKALWAAEANRGHPRAAMAMADRFCQLEADAGVPLEHRIGRRLRARCLHVLGRLAEAQAENSAMLGQYRAPSRRSHIARFNYDQRVTARIITGRVLWLQGLPDQAMREIEDNITQALSLGHKLTLTYALADGACPVALLAGGLDAAERFVALLEDNTRADALDVWHSYAACFRGELLIRRGEPATGTEMLFEAIKILQTSGFVIYRNAFLCALAKGFVELGRAAEGLAVVNDALERCGHTGDVWCRPELFRVRGQLLLAQGDTAGADGCFRQALCDAEAQGALSWTLRSVTDLAELLRKQGRKAEAVELLAPVQARFTEGFATPDIGAATSLLLQLSAF